MVKAPPGLEAPIKAATAKCYWSFAQSLVTDEQKLSKIKEAMETCIQDWPKLSQKIEWCASLVSGLALVEEADAVEETFAAKVIRESIQCSARENDAMFEVVRKAHEMARENQGLENLSRHRISRVAEFLQDINFNCRFLSEYVYSYVSILRGERKFQ